MAKKRKSKSGGSGGTANNGKGGTSSKSATVGNKPSTKDTHQKQQQQKQSPPPTNYDSSSSSSSDDDSLVLEGTLIRNPDASDSSSEDDDVSSEEEEETEVPMKKAKKSDGASKSKNNNHTKTKQQQRKKKKKKQNEPETINVEFLFCDLHTKYFHGIKTLLHRNNIHVQHSSMLSDLIIENEMVGTVLSTDDTTDLASSDKKKAATTASAQSYPTQDENVFGFASIINVTTNHTSQTIQQLKQTCLKHCPSQHKSELTTVLSGQTARPAGFFFMERMVNVPLEITYILHEQLILDMDYAIQTADDEVERKSLDFGAFIRMAPCYKTNDNSGGSGSIVYKYFDDEIFATNSEFSYSFKVPKQFKSEEDEEEDDNMWCSVIVMTKTGHRCAMKELKKMIHG